MDSIATPGDRKIVTFLLAKQIFGIDMSALIEIREWEKPTLLPGVPDYIKGVLQIRGNSVPIVDLAERLGWQPSVLHPRSCILVVNIGITPVGFLVDEVEDIVSINDNEIRPSPDVENIDEKAIAGLVQISARSNNGSRAANSGATVVLFNLDALSVTTPLAEAA